MSRWSSILLTKGYSKSVVGFDFRTRSLVDQCTLLDASPCWFDLVREKKAVPATLDCDVWQKVSGFEECWPANGFNLFDTISLDEKFLKKVKEGVPVAFELPVSLINELASTFGVIENVSSSILDSWEFLGYDIVDIRTQSSGLYSFEWESGEIGKLLKDNSIHLNSCGLIMDEEESLNMSRVFDRILPEHSPFSPCGVWIFRHVLHGLR